MGAAERKAPPARRRPGRRTALLRAVVDVCEREPDPREVEARRFGAGLCEVVPAGGGRHCPVASNALMRPRDEVGDDLAPRFARLRRVGGRQVVPNGAFRDGPGSIGEPTTAVPQRRPAREHEREGSACKEAAMESGGSPCVRVSRRRGLPPASLGLRRRHERGGLTEARMPA